MAVALISLLAGIPVRHDIAMTGEISLSGRLLPVGGLREKLLAARRAGIAEVIVPARNHADLELVPAELREKMVIHQARTVSSKRPLTLPNSASGLTLYMQGGLFDLQGTGLLTRTEEVPVP